MQVAGLLLAAGAGVRFGAPKALVRFEGEPLVQRGVRLLAAGGCAPIMVTVGAASGAVRVAVPRRVPARPGPRPRARPQVDVVTITVEDWAEGIGASLRTGLTALAATPVDAVIVALVDQPLLRAELFGRLIAVAGTTGTRPGAVVATYGGQPRNPVLLDRDTWPEVARLARGDVGARGWLRANPGRVVPVPCDDLGAPDDIDTPADLERLTRRPPPAASPDRAPGSRW